MSGERGKPQARAGGERGNSEREPKARAADWTEEW
jgi:hypothetical protein